MPRDKLILLAMAFIALYFAAGITVVVLDSLFEADYGLENLL